MNENETVTLGALIELTLEDAREHLLAPAAYASHAKRFLRLWGDIDAAAITPKLLERYIANRQAEGVKVRTVLHELAFLSRCYATGQRESLTDANPVRAARKPKAYTTRTRVLLPEEEALLVREMEPEQLELVAFAILTGVRCAEQFNLLVEDLDHASLSILLRRGKTGRPRHIPLTTEAYQIVLNWAERAGGPHVFYPRRFPKNRIRAAKWWREGPWRQTLQRAGIVGLTWHSLRHTAATRMTAAGVELGVVGRVLGHTNPVMTLRYAHHQPGQLRSAVSAIPLYGLAGATRREGC